MLSQSEVGIRQCEKIHKAVSTQIFTDKLMHRSDSIQGSDYIATQI